MRDFLVSIIIPTFNRYELVKGAIENVLLQTYSNFEVIVVEDGSSSGIKDYIRKLNNNKIVYHRHSEQKGLGAARNTGTRIAKGEYVAFLDDDDRWIEEKISLQYDLISRYNDEKIMIYCGNIRLNQNGLSEESIPKSKGKMSKFFFNGYCIGSSCMMIPRELLLSIGGHSEDLTSCIDHDLWLKLSLAGFRMDFVPKGLVYSIKHTNQRMMEDIEERLKGINQFIKKWEKIVKDQAEQKGWENMKRIYHVQTATMLVNKFSSGLISRRKLYDYLRVLLSILELDYTYLDLIISSFGKVHYTPISKSKLKIFRKLKSML